MYPKQNVKQTIETAASTGAVLSTGAMINPSVEKLARSKSPSSRQPSTSLTRKFNSLDQITRNAINETFLLNVRQHARPGLSSVSDVVKEYLG